MRLMKNGLVRETDRPAEIDRLTAAGYEVELDDEEAREVLEDNLMDLTVERLRELCRQRGMTPPASARKAELARAVAAYDLAHPKAEEAEDG